MHLGHFQVTFDLGISLDKPHARQSSLRMIRRMNSSNRGAVKAVSPWLGLQIMPLAINELRTGPKELTPRLMHPAIAPDRWGPAPSSAMARK